MHLHYLIKQCRPIKPINQAQKGFSLIEFMIAITISMFIMLGVSVAWQTAFSTQLTQTDASRLNETIRFAMDLLSREIKQAGLINTVNTSLSESNFCSTTGVGAAITGINDPATINPLVAGINFAGATVTIPNKSDAIRVRYYGEDTTAGTEATTDCIGNTAPNGTLIEDTLYVAADPSNSNEPTLWCHTSNPNSAGAPAQPMVAGIESLQLLYGEDLDQDGIINHYVPWQMVTNPDNVLSVKISIVARSPNAVSIQVPAGKIYRHFGSAYTDPGGTAGTQFTDPGDRRIRLPQPLSTEIAVRNFSHC